MAGAGLLISFITSPVLIVSIDRCDVVGLDDICPLRDLSFHEVLEFRLRHHDWGGAGLFPGLLDVRPAQDFGDFVMKFVAYRLWCAGGRPEGTPYRSTEARD